MDLAKVKEYPLSNLFVLWDIRNRTINQKTIELAREIVEFDEDVAFSIKAVAGSSGKHLVSLAEYAEDIAKREFPNFFPEEDDKDRVDQIIE
jgi:hypothetical protein